MIVSVLARLFSGEIREAHEQTQHAHRTARHEQARAWEFERQVEELEEALVEVTDQRDRIIAECVRLRAEQRRPTTEQKEGQWVPRDRMVRMAHLEQLAEHWRAQYEELRARVPADVLLDIDRAKEHGL